MDDLLHLPTPAASDVNNSDVILRGCWACGLVLFDDEPTLCTDCNTALNSDPAPTPPKGRPLAFYLKPFGPDGIKLMAAGIIETGAARAEARAAEWAIGHDLDDQARARYVGDVLGRSVVEYSDRCQRDVRLLGEQLGWKPDRP